jgi:hypothetical protein
MNVLVQINPNRTRTIIQQHLNVSDLGILSKMVDSP